MGDLVLQTHWGSAPVASYITVVRADREILIGHELLCSIRDNPASARVVLTHNFHDGSPIGHRNGSCFHGAVLHIDGRNRQLLYRIGDYENDCWKTTLEHDTL